MKLKYSCLTLKTLLISALSCVPLITVSCSDKKTDSKPSAAEVSTAAADENTVINTDLKAPFEAEGMSFSVRSGFYDTAFYLSISAADGADIYYTLDGSTPTADSLRYSSPILIKDPSDEENRLSSHTDTAQPLEYAQDFVPDKKVDKAAVVRAMTIDKNGSQSAVVSNTYFIGFGEKADYYKDVKTISIMTDEDNLFDQEKGIYVTGKVYDDWKASKDHDPNTPEWALPGNYSQKGREWEREADISFFEDGQLAASQKMGIRIHGGATRSYPQKSFNVYARKIYSAPKLEYDLFSGKLKRKSDSSPVSVFDSFTLRNGGNDALYTRFSDKLIQSLVSDRQFLTQGMEPCIVFVNGEFWGHYEITEKMGADFISTHYGVPAKDICIVKKEALDEGSEETFAEWEKLRTWIKSADFSDKSAYDELCSYVDIQGFMDYISAEIYINNSDWGKPNTAMWRTSRTDNDSPYADGKWRFVMFDTEYSSGIYGEAQPDEDSFDKLMKSDCFLADLLNAALKNEGFRKQFADTFMDIADNNFSSERVQSEIDRLADEYHDMVIDTYDRFWHGMIGGYMAEGCYSESVSSLRSFYSQRYGYITKFLKKHI